MKNVIWLWRKVRNESCKMQAGEKIYLVVSTLGCQHIGLSAHGKDCIVFADRQQAEYPTS
jgi:hypothetical protein